MELLIRNAEGNVPDKDREYAAKKLGKLDRYFKKANRVEMVHSVEKSQHRLEVTVFADGMTLRGEERDTSLRACIDRVADKLEKRLRRLKAKLIDSHRKAGIRELPPALAEEPVEQETPDNEDMIVERKRFSVKPMTPEEAILQMELVDHDFYVFQNSETASICVVYKRKRGGYGLLEPETE
ncbi:MAG: ribosome-associated translation inhibitor RaiA [Armatimonadetes bacterium]|nr:MAG: ribosome-associated translation inhibitor RaiA [Armatimonadota bacterium]